MTIDEAPSTAELYIRAQESNHLEVDPLRARAIDRIIAAGWVGDSLGTLLYRVIAEYDAAKGEAALYEAEAARLGELRRQALARRTTARQQAQETPSEEAAGLEERADAEVIRLAAEVKREITTGRALVLMRIRSLHEAKQALGRFAVIHAQAARYALPDHVVLKLAGRVLEVTLDGDCGHCHGRGSNGGSHRGEKLELCRPCRGSGKRIDSIGHSREEQQFAASLAVEMSVKLAGVERSMREFLRCWTN